MTSLFDLLKDAEEITPQHLTDGLLFGEGPRYRDEDGKLYISDMLGCKIYRIDGKTGAKEVLVEVPQQPNGMCFHPDGSLIYSSMFDAQLLRYDFATGQSSRFADLSKLMTGYCGDMVIDRQGRVYMDDTGSRVLHGEVGNLGRLIVVEPDGTVNIGPENIQFPNGIAIDSGGKKLYLSESLGHLLNTFDISGSGELSNRTVAWDMNTLANPPEINAIDGLCIDAEDALWLCVMDYNVCIRRTTQGKITHFVRLPGDPTACALGGKDGNTLFIATNSWDEGNIFQAMMERRTRGSIFVAQVKTRRGEGLP